MAGSNWRTIYRRDAAEEVRTIRPQPKRQEVWGCNPTKIQDVTKQTIFAQHKAHISGDRPAACLDDPQFDELLVFIVPGTRLKARKHLNAATVVIARSDQYPFLADTAFLCRHAQYVPVDDLIKYWGILSEDHINEIKSKILNSR